MTHRAPEAEPVLVAEGIDLARGGVQVLADVGLTALPGTVVGVVGPSGSGKTTLLTVLAGYEKPDRGTVQFAGHDVGLADPRTPIGMAHQAFGLLSLLTAAENVELALQARRVPRAEVRTRAAARLADVGLAGRADHLVEELSGGEQQRVALARALVVDPVLLLADEPTAQLDAATRQQIVDLLRRCAAGGTTVVLATHDADVADLCDQVVTLESGQVVP